MLHALEPLLYHVGPLQTADESQWTHRSSDELLAAQGRRHRHGLGSFPRRRRALPRRGPGHRVGPRGEDHAGPCATTRCPATPTRTRWWSRPAGRSSSTASTASTSTRWPWRWRSCRCGWSRWTRSGPSRFSTTGWWRATRCWGSRRWSRSSTCASTRNRPASGGRARCRGRRTCAARSPRRPAARRRLTEIELGDDPIAALEHKRLLLGRGRRCDRPAAAVRRPRGGRGAGGEPEDCGLA